MEHKDKNQTSDESQPVSAEQEVRIDPARLEMLTQNLRAKQNLTGGLLAGIVAALLGAVTWGAITAATNYQIGWMAIGVGFLVGIAVRKFGQGIDMAFGVMGAALALFGCLVGNIFTACIQIANSFDVGYLEVLGSLDFGMIVEIMAETFHPMDLLFYGIAMYAGYKYSFYSFSSEEVQALTKKA